MSDPKKTHCLVRNCKSTIFNKGNNVSFYRLPTHPELKNKWIGLLKSRCGGTIDWNKSRICSRHFENKYFDSQRQLKSNAVPTQFPTLQTYQTTKIKHLDNSPIPQTKIDRLLNNVSEAELHDDIKNTMNELKVPDQLSSFVTDDLQCRSNTSTEMKLWLLVKKQDHLITRLKQVVSQNKMHIEVMQNNLQETRAKKKEMEQAMENYKYLSKCLQEKHATLEEQIEILTAVESRT